jgi:hypothetical protein
MKQEDGSPVQIASLLNSKVPAIWSYDSIGHDSPPRGVQEA